VPTFDSISASFTNVDTLEVDAHEVESFGLGSEDWTLESLEAKSFVLTSEDLSLSSQVTKSLDTNLESQEFKDFFVPQAVLIRTGNVNIPPVGPQPVPTGKPKAFAPVPTGKPKVSTPVPTGKPKVSTLVPTGNSRCLHQFLLVAKIGLFQFLLIEDILYRIPCIPKDSTALIKTHFNTTTSNHCSIILSYHIEMDLIISLGQKNTLSEYMILSGADNRPPILDKDLYDSWKSQMELYMQNREHGRMILESVKYGPLIWPTVEENGVIRTKKYAELSAAKKIQADCDMKATNIILQGLPADIYSLINHHRKMNMEKFQVNTKFLISLPPEWSKFLTDVKLVKICIPQTMISFMRILNNTNSMQMKTSSNTRNQATIQDGRVRVQQVQGRQGQNYSGTTYKGNAMSSRGNNTSGQARVVKCYNCQEAQDAGQILDEEQLAFLVNPGIPAG
nr:hypothetical protein [Tanacetum cinerariifolium]